MSLNFEQNIETLSKILSIIGQKKELPERKIIGQKKELPERKIIGQKKNCQKIKGKSKSKID